MAADISAVLHKYQGSAELRRDQGQGARDHCPTRNSKSKLRSKCSASTDLSSNLSPTEGGRKREREREEERETEERDRKRDRQRDKGREREKINCGSGRVAQVAELLLGRRKALSSNPSTK
jgi:hypothetical protein